MRNVANKSYLPGQLIKARQAAAGAIRKYRRKIKAMVQRSGQVMRPEVLEFLNQECRRDAELVSRKTYHGYRQHVSYEDILKSHMQAPNRRHPDTAIMLGELASHGVYIDQG